MATIVGTVVSLLALIQSQAWLVSICVVFVCVSIVVGLYARNARLTLNSASTVIEGHSIDSLNIANLRRRINRTFVIQEAHDTVRIQGEDMEITWKYAGYCKKENTPAIEFSVDSDDRTPFDKLDCAAFDLVRDPLMSHEIRPILIGTESLSKKISVPFLKPLRANENFSVMLRCTLPRCLRAGFGYYASTLSFAQDRVQRSCLQSRSCHRRVEWARHPDLQSHC